MGVQDWAQIGAAVGVVPLAQWLWRKLRRDAKGDAEAHKINVEADGLIVTRLWAEIERLDRDLGTVRSELATVRRTAEDEKTHLETENKALKAEVRKLRNRVRALEAIFAVGPTPPEMQVALDKLKDVE